MRSVRVHSLTNPRDEMFEDPTDRELVELYDLMTHIKECDPVELKSRVFEMKNRIKLISEFPDSYAETGIVDMLGSLMVCVSENDTAEICLEAAVWLAKHSQFFSQLFIQNEGSVGIVKNLFMQGNENVKQMTFQLVKELSQTADFVPWVLETEVLTVIVSVMKDMIAMFNENPHVPKYILDIYKEALNILHDVAVIARHDIDDTLGVYFEIIVDSLSCSYMTEFSSKAVELLVLLSGFHFEKEILRAPGLVSGILGLLADNINRPCYTHVIQLMVQILSTDEYTGRLEDLIPKGAIARIIQIFIENQSDGPLAEACIKLFTNTVVKDNSVLDLLLDWVAEDKDTDHEDTDYDVPDCGDPESYEEEDEEDADDDKPHEEEPVCESPGLPNNVLSALYNITEAGNTRLQDAALRLFWVMLSQAQGHIMAILEVANGVLATTFLSDTESLLTVALNSISIVMENTARAGLLNEELYQAFLQEVLPYVEELVESNITTLSEKASEILYCARDGF